MTGYFRKLRNSQTRQRAESECCNALCGVSYPQLKEQVDSNNRLHRRMLTSTRLHRRMLTSTRLHRRMLTSTRLHRRMLTSTRLHRRMLTSTWLHRRMLTSTQLHRGAGERQLLAEPLPVRPSSTNRKSQCEVTAGELHQNKPGTPSKADLHRDPTRTHRFGNRRPKDSAADPRTRPQTRGLGRRPEAACPSCRFCSSGEQQQRLRGSRCEVFLTW